VQPHFGEEAAGTRGEVLALVMAHQPAGAG